MTQEGEGFDNQDISLLSVWVLWVFLGGGGWGVWGVVVVGFWGGRGWGGGVGVSFCGVFGVGGECFGGGGFGWVGVLGGVAKETSSYGAM